MISSDPCSRLLIVGAGNELLSDEGLGVHVARALLRDDEVVRRADVVDAGTSSLDLLAMISGRSRVVVVDAIRADREPGTLYRVEITPEILADADSPPSISLHDWGLLDTLRAAALIGRLPGAITLIGAEPESLVSATSLSPRLAAAAERIVTMVKQMATQAEATDRPR